MLKSVTRKIRVKKEEKEGTEVVSGKGTADKVVSHKMNGDKKSKIKLFDNIAKYAIYFLIGLLPIFFLPTPLIELGQAKLALLVVSVLVAVVALSLSIIYGGSVKIIDKRFLIPIISISVITFISALFSTSYTGGTIGTGAELDSWYLISLLLLVPILLVSIIITKERLFKVFALFWIGFGVASLFQLFRLLASTLKLDLINNLLSLGGRFDLPALNMIGTWGDFGIVAGVGALSLAITLDMVPLQDRIKKVAWGLFGLFALMSFVASSIIIGSGMDQLNNGSQFVIPSMTIIGVFALFFALFQLVQRRKESNSAKSIKFPVANFVLIVLGFILLVSPLGINQKINQMMSVPNESVLNVRPGVSDTYVVSKSVLSSSFKNALLGVGPHGFYIAWNKYRPDYVNKLDLWNTDYQFGSSYLMTQIVNNGVLGFIAWIASLIALFVFGFKKIFGFKAGNKQDQEKLEILEVSSVNVYSNMVVFTPALFLWFNALINVSGAMVLILTFIFTGLMLANFVINKEIKMMECSFEGESISNKYIPWKIPKNKLSIVVMAILMVLVLCLAVLWIQRTRAEAYSVKSMQMIYAKNASISTVPTAMFLLQKAYNIYRSDAYARGINNLALVQINYDISSSPANQDLEALQNGQAVSMSSSTIEYLKVAVSSGRASVDGNGNDFRNLLQFGSTMQTVALLNLEKDAGDLAQQSFLKAIELFPNHPLPMYSLANLYVLAGDKESAKKVLEQTLKVKPNFEEANDLYQGILVETFVPATASMSASTTSTAKSVTSTSTVKAKAPVKKTLKAPAKSSVKAPVIKKSTSTSTTATTSKVIKTPVKK